ncbi:MAG: hypothetical protein IT195_02195 [Microthrixaceae bacterium]|nr:hypothetical protein [Microthrixaceae bacterium]
MSAFRGSLADTRFPDTAAGAAEHDVARVARKRLRAARLDNSHDAEVRKTPARRPQRVDDRDLQPRTGPDEWLALIADPLLAQSAVDRLKSAAYELIVDGDGYRNHQKRTLTT